MHQPGEKVTATPIDDTAVQLGQADLSDSPDGLNMPASHGLRGAPPSWEVHSFFQSYYYLLEVYSKVYSFVILDD